MLTSKSTQVAAAALTVVISAVVAVVLGIRVGWTDVTTVLMILLFIIGLGMLTSTVASQQTGSDRDQ